MTEGHMTKALFSPRLRSARTQRCTYTAFFALFNNLNGPFLSCSLSRFRSESWCSTIVREMQQLGIGLFETNLSSA